MVEGMSVVVNVILSVIIVMSPPPALCNLSIRTVVKLCTLGVFALEVSLVSWIVMTYACVLWISILSPLSLFLIQFMLTWNIMRFLSLLLLGLCACMVVCSHVVVIGLSVRLSWYPMWWEQWLLDVSMLRECQGDGNADVGNGWGVVAVSVWHEYVGSTRGSGIVSSAADVLGMSVVREMRGVGGVCWNRALDLCIRCGGVGGELGLGSGRELWCYVCMCCESGFFM